MKKTLYSLFFLFMSGMTFAQSDFKMEEVKCFSNSMQTMMLCKDLNDNLLNGILHFETKTFSMNEEDRGKDIEDLFITIRGDIKFQDGKPEGELKLFYPKGSVFTKGTYKAGRKDGTFTTYDEKGNRLAEENYLNGVLHGPFIVYKNEEKLQEIVFNHGEQVSARFGEEEISIAGNENDDEKQNKIKKTFFKNGNLRTEQEYKDGLPVGNMKIYYVDGTLKGELTFKNGKAEEPYLARHLTEDKVVIFNDGSELLCESSFEDPHSQTQLFCRDRKDVPVSGKYVVESVDNKQETQYFFDKGRLVKVITSSPCIQNCTVSKNIDYYADGTKKHFDIIKDDIYDHSWFYEKEVTYEVSKNKNGHFSWRTMAYGGSKKPNPNTEIVSYSDFFQFPKTGTILSIKENPNHANWYYLSVKAQDDNIWDLEQKNPENLKSGDAVVFVRGSYDAMDNLSVKRKDF